LDIYKKEIKDKWKKLTRTGLDFRMKIKLGPKAKEINFLQELA
jgi:hypothetical protein